MERITYKQKKGVFLTDTELGVLQEKILAQRQLIDDLAKEVEV